MKTPPAFQFYASDYLSSSKVQRMTLEAQGAYVRLLCYSWQDGYIPADVALLARLCNCTVKRMAVLWDSFLRDCFIPSGSDPDKLVNARLEEVRSKVTEFKAERSQSGKLGAAKRWKDHSSANDSAIEQPLTKNSSPVFSLHIPPIVPQNGNGKTETGYAVEFEEFWKEYPKRIGKGAAFREWKKLRPSQALQDSILHALKHQKLSLQWNRDGGVYIPNPSTWLHQRRWDDDIPSGRQHDGDIVV